MGNYDQRPVEMRRQLTEAVSGREGDPVFVKLDGLVTQWGEAREVLLDRLVALAVAARTGDPARLAEEWTGAIKSGRAELKTMFENGAKDLKLPIRAQAWWMAAILAEDGFLDELSRVPTMDLIGKLRSQRMIVETMTLHLDKKWTALNDTTASFRTPQMQAIDEIEKMALAILAEHESASKKALEDATRIYEKNRAKLLAAEEKAKGLSIADMLLFVAELAAGALGANTEGVKDTLKEMMVKFDNYIQLAKINNDARLAKIRYYKENLRQQGYILQMFKEERRLVAEYDRTNGIEVSRNHVIWAKDTAGKWAASRATDGQKADAAVMAALLIAAVQEVFEETLDVDEDFRDKYEGLFVDRISETSLEALTSEDQFKRILAELDALDIGDKLDSAAKSAPQIFFDAVDEAFSEVEASVADFPVEAHDLLFLKSRAMQAEVKTALKAKLDEMTAISTDIAKQHYPGEIEGNFDRRELSDVLD